MGGSLFAQPALYVPVILDVIQNGTGPTGLCLGGGFTSGVPVQASCTGVGGTWVPSGVPAGKAALAALLRDVHLWAYNTKVQVIDPTSANPLSTFDWGLIYTYGKLDADIFFYPEGRGTGITPTATASGIKADITLTAQSPGFWERANSSSAATRALAGSNWRNNTHFMLADTNVGGGGTRFGVGLVNADLLWVARNVYFRTIAGDSGYPDLPGGLWIQTDSGSRYYMRGYFGGGMMNDLSQPVAMALIELDLSTNRFIFVMHPVAPVNNNAPIGFAALFDLDGQAKFSLAEKSSPTSSFQFYNLGGRLAWREGRIALTSGQNTPSGKPDLRISNELLIGASANFGSGGGAPLIGNAGFGSESYGRIIMPGGVWYNEFTLKIP